MSNGCDRCACYARGLQDAVWETYLVNIAVTAVREQLEAERQSVHRWSE